MDNRNAAERLAEIKNAVYNAAGCCRGILHLSSAAMGDSGKAQDEDIIAIMGIADTLVNMLYDAAGSLDEIEQTAQN